MRVLCYSIQRLRTREGGTARTAGWTEQAAKVIEVASTNCQEAACLGVMWFRRGKATRR